VPEGFVFSYPVTLSPRGYWTVVQDIELTEQTKEKLQDAVKVSPAQTPNDKRSFSFS
jgi:malate/lactate dehydrogenase